MYRLKKNSWQPARLRRGDHLLFSIVLVVIAYLRGLDYASGEDTWMAKDFMVAAAPAEVWGFGGFLAGAVALSYGMLSRRHIFVYAGHAWLALSYGLNSLAHLLVVAPDIPYFDGIRGMGATFLVALVHALGALRTGPDPLQIEQSSTMPAELIVQDGDPG